MQPFSVTELDRALQSLKNLAGDSWQAVDEQALRELLSQSAHRSHQDWADTEQSARRLLGLVSEKLVRRCLHRPLRDGRFDEAVAATTKPWVVLVTGVNGVRKTTMMSEPWIRKALLEGLVAPPGSTILGPDDLPWAGNSFFRQLDYTIAAIANEDFRSLYAGRADVETYSRRKGHIFSRYRTIAEMWGICLIRSAQERRVNVLVETTGRDVGMYKYIEYMFPGDSYRKLVINFEVDDIRSAARSVDARMRREMAAGERVADVSGVQAGDIVAVNLGGPYGSSVLPKVQAESREVWAAVARGDSGVAMAATWYKASIRVNTSEGDQGWSAQADVPGSTKFLFTPRSAPKL